MDFEPGEILVIKEFEFPRKGIVVKKDKYMIPLIKAGDQVLLVGLPSSKAYISEENKKAGCINIPTISISIYYFPARKKIGNDGFYFPKDTFLYLRQIFETTNRKLLQYNVDGKLERLDKLSIEEFKNLIYCTLKSNQVPEKYKDALEKKLESLFSL
ncbi:MAG: hypothetical protein AAGJ93_02940 [Bacteroidota bacterium]